MNNNTIDLILKIFSKFKETSRVKLLEIIDYYEDRPEYNQVMLYYLESIYGK
jgi:hypothetical protein